jgi:hypothetical protein
MVNLYLLFGAVEAGFINLWIIMRSCSSGASGEAVVAHAVRWCTARPPRCCFFGKSIRREMTTKVTQISDKIRCWFDTWFWPRPAQRGWTVR